MDWGAIGMGAAIGLGGGLSFFGASNARRAGRHRRQALADALRWSIGASGSIADAAIGSNEFQAARSFYLNTVQSPMKNPLVKNFSRGLQQIEASRGMYFSPAAAADEARRLAGLGARLQMQAAPGLMGLVGWKERYRQEIFPQLAEYRVRYRTGGRYGWRGGKQAPAPINPTLAGITGAMQAGAMGLQMFGGLGGLGGVNAIGATVA